MKDATAIILGALAVLGGGCQTTVAAGHVLTPEDEQAIRDANPRQQLQVVVPVGVARGVRASLVRVLPGQAVLLPDEGAGELSVPASAIHRVDAPNHARGALKGAAIGLVAGATAGALIGAAYGPYSNPYPSGISLGTAMVFSGVIAGMAGTLFGLIVGGVHGDVTSYRFD